MGKKHKQPIDGTQLAAEVASLDATVPAGGQVDQAALRQAEQAVGFEWKPGDVILDLYEVRPVIEGFGEDVVEKDYHEGGFGRVYKVWHRTWRCEMAVKTPRAGMFATEEQQEAFTRECETWINLGLHPNTVSCHYVRRLGGVPRVFSEYAEAGTLEDWIRSGRLYEGDERSALARMLDSAIQFAWGLHYAHERGVIHQDVKPLNAVLWNDGTLKVTDFGLAGARQKAGIEGPAGDVSGGMQSILVSVGGMTPSFCSPEQAAGKTLDRRTDVWSWAVSVLEMFQGEVTWQSGILAGEALEEFLRRGGKEENIPAMPAGVSDLLRRCFRSDPADRPRTLQDCAKVLGKVYETETGRSYPRAEPKAAEMDADNLNNRGLSLLDLGRVDEALAVWEKALARHAGHFETTYNQQVQLWWLGRVTDQDAVRAITEAKKNRPGDWSAAYHLGLVHLARSDGESAKEILSEAVSLGGGSEAQAALQRAEELSRVVGRCVRTFEGHTANVNSVCLSADGRWALSGSSDYTLRLWEVSSGRCVRKLGGHITKVHTVCLSSDGRWALSGNWNETFHLWEISTGQCLQTFEGHNVFVSSVCLSADDRWACSGNTDGTLRLWDVSSGRCVKTFEGHKDCVTSVCLSADGRWMLSGSKDSTLRLWEISSGRCVRIFKGHTNEVTSVCISADGRWALSGCGSIVQSKNNTLRLWEVSSGRCVRMFKGHTEMVRSVYLSADGRWALSGSQDTTLRLWDVPSGRCVRTFEGHTGPVESVCLGKDGRWALSSGGYDKTLRLWEVSSITEEPSLESPSALLSRVRGVEEVLSTQDRFADLVASARQTLHEGRYADTLALVREARNLAGYEKSPEAMSLWNAAGLAGVRLGFRSGWCVRTFEGHTKGVTSVSLSSDGRWALSGSLDGTIRLWEVSSGRCIRIFEGHKDCVFSVCLSTDGSWALSASRDKTLLLWKVSSGRCVRKFEGHTDSVTSVCMSSDGRWALSGSLDGTIRLWEVSSGHCVRMFKGHTESVCSVCLSADGRWVLSGSRDNTLRLWNVSNGLCLRKLERLSSEGYTTEVLSVCLSSDGRWALSGIWDKIICLWEISSGRCVRTFEGHTGDVKSVYMSSDGRWALSGSGSILQSKDNTLRLWDVSSGRCERTFEGHTESVNSVSLSIDGRWALSGSGDKTLRLWELDWDFAAHEPTDWDEGARPYLVNFLINHCTRGRPVWTETDFQSLLRTLACAGYGWLRPDGVKRELDKMAADSQSRPQNRTLFDRIGSLFDKGRKK